MNDRERLEEICKRAKHRVLENSRGEVRYRFTEINTEDYEWLVGQAERVEELELELNDWRAEVHKWQQFYKESEESHLETKEFLRSMISEIKRYKQALEFYADEENWISTLTSIGDFPCEVEKDQGEIARKALEGDNLKSERMKCLYCEEEIKD